MDRFHILFLLILILVGLCEGGDSGDGTRWAVLVAGSNGYMNYRHQADVCHAYQILKKGGLKDENIVVFMYDDIAYNPHNPRPGVIINSPNGIDVYKGVPKDYTGEQVTAENLFAVILGDKKSVRGGSGKVVNSKPNDHIFIYYSDHGSVGVLAMPTAPHIYANDFIRILKKKNAMNSYKEMVIYIEACESGSMFEGLLPSNLNIYVTTAANAVEDSWATYCPSDDPTVPEEYSTCLGDLYSASWMEHSETHNLKEETISRQYEIVRKRTSRNGNYYGGSHVMEYGSMHIKSQMLSNFQGYNPRIKIADQDDVDSNKPMRVVNQRDADLLFYLYKYRQLEDGNKEKENVLKELTEKMEHRAHIDRSVEFIGKLIFGFENASAIIASPTPSGHPIVDDWSCLKSMIRLYESHCGTLSQYGLKHTRAFANICNKGISEKSMEEACIGACGNYNLDKWSPLIHGYSA